MITPQNINIATISYASDQELIEAYSHSQLNFEDEQYDMIAYEMTIRGILEV